MTSGYELTEPEPTAVNMLDVAHCGQVSIFLYLYPHFSKF